MCGIFGWSGRNVKHFNKDKFNILGMVNQERGRDSCGIGINGEIHIGLEKTKLYEDFVSENYHSEVIFQPKEIKSIIGHTRNASVGSVNYDNAHPFGFGTHKNGYAFMGVHNGTIYNKEDLAKEFKIRPTRKTNKKERIHKIDSEILLESIYRDISFEVLGKYRGAAALAFINSKTPDVLYLFRGASLKYSAVNADERPLYVYIENKNSMYFSSLMTPLKYIGGDFDSIVEIKENTVYEIKNGDIKRATTYKIDRSKTSQNNIAPSTYSAYNNKNKAYQRHRSEGYYNNIMGYDESYDLSRRSRMNTIPGLEDLEEIDYEDIPDSEDDIDNGVDDDTSGDISSDFEETGELCLEYKDNLRFYNKTENKLAEGVYCFIPGKGLKFVNKAPEAAARIMKDRIGQYYYNDKFRTAVYNDKFVNEAFVPFPLLKSGRPEDYLYYFVEGCMLKSRKDYYPVSMQAGQIDLSSQKLSVVSVYPVRELKERDSNGMLNIVYYNGKHFTGKILATGSTRSTYINSGVIKRTRRKRLINDLESSHKTDYFTLITKKATSSTKEEREKLKNFKEMAKETLDEALLTTILSFDTTLRRIKDIEKYKDTKKVKDALKKCEGILYETYADVFEKTPKE